jgi:multidrug efflux pump
MKLTNLSIDKSLTVFVLIFIIFIVGLYSYIALPREAAPDIQIPYIIVNTLYFGVAPADIETLVTNPIEKKLKGLKDVKEITSTSGDSISSIAIEFNTNVDIDDALQKVRDKVDQAKSDIPDDAEDSEILEINFSDIPILVLSVSGKYDLERLKNVAENLKDSIETVPGVLSASLSGGLEREIQIIADKDKLKQYKIALSKISQAIGAENITIPGGTIDIGRSKYLVRVPGEFKKISDIENIVIDTPEKTPIYLKDVASVHDTFKEKETYSRLSGAESVSLSIQKRTGENVIKIVQKINEIITKQEKSFPPTTKVVAIADQSEDIKDMVNELENSIILGLILVVLVLFSFMGIRNAIFVATAIPFSMLLTFIFLYAIGYTLNMVLLFSLILALGMLVDNAIVIVENIYRYIENGHNRIDAAKKATAEVAKPVITSTLTTIAAFFPIIFMPGISGEFMKYLPIGVIVTITASLLVALIINPVLCANLMSKAKTKKRDIKDVNPEGFFEKKVAPAYRRLLLWCVKRRKETLLITSCVFIVAILIYATFSPGVEFFPDITPSEIYIDVTTYEDSTIEATNKIVKRIEQFLFENKNVARIITTVGSASGGMDFGATTAPNKARIIAEFQDKGDWKENPQDTIKKIRNFVKNIPGAVIEVKKESMGPPTGAPINIQIQGPDFEVLTKLTEKTKKLLSSIEGITNIKDNYIKGRPEISITIDRDKAAIFDMNTSMIASAIRTAIQGSKISVFREGTEEYDITLKYPTDKTRGIKTIEEMTLVAKEGKLIPLIEVAQIDTRASIGSIKHIDQDRVISVEAEPDEGYLAYNLLTEAQKTIDTWQLPEEYQINFAGESEEQEIMGNYLLKAFIIAILLIGIILITHFDSIFLPFIIITSVFLSLIGIFLGLTVFHRPFGVVMTGIGIISLAGVVVNNGIVLIDYMRLLQDKGLNRMSAVIRAGTIRLRPVMLTAITTILGLVPMTFGINFDFKQFFQNFFKINPFSNFFSSLDLMSQSTEFWGSMGSAVTIGLAVGTVLTLIIVPVLYVSIDNISKKVKNKNGSSS